MTSKTLIVDASAVINGFVTKYSDSKLITTTKVVKELKSRGEIEDLIEHAPKKDIIRVVSNMNKDLSDKISEADKELLALAIEFRAPVVTDDYGIQNIAKKLGVEFIPVLEEGITKIIEWEYYCSGCRRKAGKSGVCKTCGGKIKRREK